MSANLFRWELCSRKKSSGVIETKLGKGSRVMLVVDGYGLSIGLHLASAQPLAITMEGGSLRTVREPPKHGRPRSKPKALATGKTYDGHTFLTESRKWGIQVAIST